MVYGTNTLHIWKSTIHAKGYIQVLEQQDEFIFFHITVKRLMFTKLKL